MQSRGARATVNCVPRKTSKAEFILSDLDAESGRTHDKVALFVDDDIREHADPRLRNCLSLHQVLFLRAT